MQGGSHPNQRRRSTSRSRRKLYEENSGAHGYYERFFKEERRLGMGANGTVYLWSVRQS